MTKLIGWINPVVQKSGTSPQLARSFECDNLGPISLITVLSLKPVILAINKVLISYFFTSLQTQKVLSLSLSLSLSPHRFLLTLSSFFYFRDRLVDRSLRRGVRCLRPG